LQFNDLQTTKS